MTLPADSAPARQAALEATKRLRDAGYLAYWAGGCVRDLLMGRAPKDYDIATGARPQDIQRLFPRTVGVGKAFGVIRVLLGESDLDVATFRRDAGYADGRRPESVVFADAAEDARRRDFTINGLFYDPIQEQVVDFVDGRRDIEARIVRAIGVPADRFREDHLRMLRAVRFASTLDFEIEPQTSDAIRQNAARIADVSAERIQQELTRLLTESPRAGRGLERLRDTGLLDVVLPEVARMQGQEQPPAFHPEGDVFAHTVLMLNAMNRPGAVLAYAVLLHDVGKPATAVPSIQPDGSRRVRFDGHDHVGAVLAEGVLRRLRMPARETEDIVHCVRNHMRFMMAQRMKRSTLRRLVSSPTFSDELELHRLDCEASHRDLANYEFLQRFVAELRNEPALPEPWINGRDLMAMGLPEGPDVGRWLRVAYDAQLEGRFQGPDELRTWIRRSLAESNGKRGNTA